MKQIKKIEKQQQTAKDKAKKIQNVTKNEDDEITRLMKMIIAVTVIVLTFFGITYLLTKKDNKVKEEPTEIQYKEILVGEIWNMGGTYYVLAGKEEDQDLSLYESYLADSSGSNLENAYYTINLDSVFNRKYVAETSNLYTGNPGEIRFKGTTLLKVSEGKVVEAYEGSDAITSYLENLIQ